MLFWLLWVFSSARAHTHSRGISEPQVSRENENEKRKKGLCNARLRSAAHMYSSERTYERECVNVCVRARPSTLSCGKAQLKDIFGTH